MGKNNRVNASNLLFSSDFLSINESSRCGGFLNITTSTSTSSSAAASERTTRAKRREMGITVREHIVKICDAEWTHTAERIEYGTELRSITIIITRSSIMAQAACEMNHK